MAVKRINPHIEQIDFQGIPITIVRKQIRNLYIRVTPPDGNVVVSAPIRAAKDAVFAFIARKHGWITAARSRVAGSRPAAPRFADRDIIQLWGNDLQLRYEPEAARPPCIDAGGVLVLPLPAHAPFEKRIALIRSWYRGELASRLPVLTRRWQLVCRVEAASWQIRRMKSRWGSCNPVRKRIAVNLELARLPESLLEYIIVHELMHLLEPRHNERFYQLLELHYPQWRTARQQLKSADLQLHGAG